MADVKFAVNGLDITITMDIDSMVRGLHDDDRRNLGEMLAIDEHLYRGIVAHLVGEQFSLDYYQPSVAWLDALREKVLALLPEVEKVAIRTAIRERDQAQHDLRVFENWLRQYTNDIGNCGDCIKGCRAHAHPLRPRSTFIDWPTPEQIEAYIAAAKGGEKEEVAANA